MPPFNCAECDEILLNWENTGDPALRAMGVNVRYDHRISEERLQEFHGYITPACTEDALQRAFKKYHEDRVRPRRNPDFILPHLNGQNLVASYRRPVPLIRALALNGLKDVFQAARGTNDVFAFFPSRPDEKSVSEWLDGELLGQSDAKIRRFIEATVKELDSARRKQAFQPVWATLWHHFTRYDADPAERWMEALGISWEPAPQEPGDPVPARWVVLLKYTVGEAGTLVRPTQFDAGWYAAHFPSPDGVEVDEGGHPVDLGDAKPPLDVLPEFIHLEITHAPDHYYRIGRTEKPARSGLPSRRRLHHDRLRSFYADRMDVYRWMPGNCTT